MIPNKSMKTLTHIAGLVAAGALIAWFSTDRQGRTKHPPALPPTVGQGETLAIAEDAAEIFKKAFWKRPSEGDRIIHADRREWSDDNGIARWEWFVAVDPSPTFTKHLIETNPFRLSVLSTPSPTPQTAPEWYPRNTESFELRVGPRKDMAILIDGHSGRLFATGRGHGFARSVAAPSTSRPAIAVTTSGRLPTSSPPNPPTP